MTPGISSSTPASTGNAAGTATSAATAATDKNMFLQLLVAQIRNQDPLNPSDPMQYVTQLAQFTQLEQSIDISTNLAAIRQDIEQFLQPAGTTTGETT